MSQAETVRKLESLVADQQRKIESLENTLKVAGEAIDVNANVLKHAILIINLLQRKTGITNEEIAQAFVDASKKLGQESSIQPAGTGTVGDNSGQPESGLSDRAVNGDAQGSSTGASNQLKGKQSISGSTFDERNPTSPDDTTFVP